MDPSVVVAFQRELQRRGYTEIGAADGDVGRRTMAAVAHFRQDKGLVPLHSDYECLPD
jgi:peptidoglycan hydrolase-like protein with peptidoglycan-binding domain